RGIERGVGDGLAPLLRIEEESLVPVPVVAQQRYRTAESESKVIPAHGRDSRRAVGGEIGGAIVEGIAAVVEADSVGVVAPRVGVQLVVAEEFVEAAVKLAGSALGDDIVLTASGPRRIGPVRAD